MFFWLGIGFHYCLFCYLDGWVKKKKIWKNWFNHRNKEHNHACQVPRNQLWSWLSRNPLVGTKPNTTAHIHLTKYHFINDITFPFFQRCLYNLPEMFQVLKQYWVIEIMLPNIDYLFTRSHWSSKNWESFGWAHS